MKSYLEKIDSLIKSMNEYVKYSHYELMTMVCWAIATHAHDKFNLFALLRLTSSTHTGKTNATKFVADLCRAPKRDGEYCFGQIKGSSDKAIRDLINQARNRKATCCFDEADNFPTEYIESIFDRDGASTHKLENVGMGQGQGTAWSLSNKNLFAPVMLNGREFLTDESHQNRTIEITGLSDTEWLKTNGREYKLGTNSDMRAMFEEIASQIDWSEVTDKTWGGRAHQCWAPLKAVARFLGAEEYLAYIEMQIQDTYEEYQQGRAEETDYKVIEAMLVYAIKKWWNRVQAFPLSLHIRIFLRWVEGNPGRLERRYVFLRSSLKNLEQ